MGLKSAALLAALKTKETSISFTSSPITSRENKNWTKPPNLGFPLYKGPPWNMPCIAYPGQFQFGTSWWVLTLHRIPWLWWRWSWRWCWSSPRGAWYACWAPRLSEQRSPHFGGSDELPTTDPWSIVQKSCGAPLRPPPVTQRRRLLETHTPPFPRAATAYRQLPAHQFSAFCLGIIARDGQTGVPNNSIQCEWICRLNFPPEMRWTLFALCVVWMKWNGETRSSWLNCALMRWWRKRGHAIKYVLKLWTFSVLGIGSVILTQYMVV